MQLPSIEQLHADGIELDDVGILDSHRELVRANSRVHGSWGNAVRFAGYSFDFSFPLKKTKIRKGKQQVVSDFIALVRKHGVVTEDLVDEELLNRIHQSFASIDELADSIGAPVRSRLFQETMEETVTCQICEKEFRSLMSHLRHKHKISTDEYTETWGLGFLVSESMRYKAACRTSDNPEPPLSKAEICIALKEHAKLVSPLIYRKLFEIDHTLASSAIRLFGSWEAAMKALDIDCVEAESWSKRKVIQRIRQFARKHSKDELHMKHVNDAYPGFQDAVWKYLGTWADAVVAAGLDPLECGVRRRGLTEEQAAEELKRWSDEHGPISANQLRRSDVGLYAFITRNFGPIHEFAEKHGLPHIEWNTESWTKAKILEKVRELHTPGQYLSLEIATKTYPNLKSAVRYHFGSWLKAKEIAGIDEEDRTKTDPKHLKDRVMKWQREHGELIGLKMMKTDGTLYRDLLRKYGTFRKALAALSIG